MQERANPPWIAPPAIPGPWKELTSGESTAVAARLGAAVAAEKLRGIATIAALHRIRAMPLPFYGAWLLLECAASLPDDAEGIVSFLYGPGTRIVLLDLTSEPLHRVNALAPLGTLDDDALARAYLRFFCAHLVGDDGRFRIVESADEIDWAAGRPPEPLPDAVRAIRPIEELPKGPPDGSRRLRCSVVYGGSLFLTTFALHEGSVEMIEDEPLGVLDVREEVIAPPFRIVRAARADGAGA